MIHEETESCVRTFSIPHGFELEISHSAEGILGQRLVDPNADFRPRLTLSRDKVRGN